MSALGPCLLWTGKVHRGPPSRQYGYLTYEGRHVLAHRYEFFRKHGRWPAKVLRHRCDTPRCVRLDHLVEGTQSQNVMDAVERGRWRLGERAGMAKLSNAQVETIKAAPHSWGVVSALAREHGVNNGTISRIRAGKSRRHG